MSVALTIHQPWASLIAHGIKVWETRPHPPAGWPGIAEGVRRMPGCRVEPGETVLIHAGTKRPEHLSRVGEWAIHSQFTEPDSGPEIRRLGSVDNGELVPDRYERGLAYPMPLGAVVATARIADVVPIDVVPYPHGMDRWVWAPPGRLDYCQLVYHEDYGGVGEHPVDISDQLPYGDWRPGRWAWRLSDVRKLDEPVSGYMKPEPHNDGGGLPCRREWCAHDVPREAVPVRGRQGVWRPDPALVEACGAAS